MDMKMLPAAVVADASDRILPVGPAPEAGSPAAAAEAESGPDALVAEAVGTLSSWVAAAVLLHNIVAATHTAAGVRPPPAGIQFDP